MTSYSNPGTAESARAWFLRTAREAKEIRDSTGRPDRQDTLTRELSNV